ncbi:nuclear transport factor 2 family protein [Salinispora sp. H7-4]|uniref:nuclear transport factor 2 family protein n=1 Tax=Salinispora sp. H7-4 TaxID=2748321 RepID=UPI0015D1BF4A|nr:nuclear transport factor 2 family protein [Salinispora sp. H7-4]NYT92585.1 nuclear transport factor 2 family protein [Salinispora sp. H7-4]
MSDLANTIGRYIDMWNEADPTRRVEKIRSICAENATYTDPMAHVRGHEAINALIGSAQEQFTGMTFTLAGPVDVHHDIARFTWHLAPAGAAEPVVVGFDMVTADDEGRLSAVYGFLDKVPTAG